MESLRGKSFKTIAVVLSLTLLVVAGYFIFSPAKLTAESQKPLYSG